MIAVPEDQAYALWLAALFVITACVWGMVWAVLRFGGRHAGHFVFWICLAGLLCALAAIFGVEVSR